MQTDILTSALDYLSLGFSVIPLRQRSKEPLTKWTEFQTRRASGGEVKSWFSTSNLNLGIVTGAVSGIAVIDLDGPEGLASGRNLGLRSSVVSLTGNGRQVFYKWTNGIQNSVKALAPGVDVRGEGGYVVAPPSLHPNGKQYRWHSRVTASSAASLPPFPAHLIAKDVQTIGSEPKNAKGWIADALEGMTNGNIDTTLHRICSRLRNDNWDMEDARIFLAPHAEKAGATPGHLDAKIRNAWARYTPKKDVAGLGWMSIQQPSLRTGLTLHSPSNPDSIDEFSKRQLDFAGERIGTGYSQFDTLTKGLKKGECLTVAARTGVGKTNWVITPIREFCRNGQRVLLFSTEMSFDQIWQRYQATLQPTEDFRQHKLFICDEFTPDIERIEEAIKNVNPDLFVFDHISHIGTDYHIISKFMSEIKRLTRLYAIPAIVTAQLNRNADYVDQGARIEPRLSMIQGSDQIGQMSAQVLLLNEKRIVAGTTEIEGIVVKNRHGDKGMVQFGLRSKPHYEMVEL